MTQITDVGPSWSNINASADRSVIGRMLSVACAPNGEAVYVGSYSNIWASDDGGRNFHQLTWPQPAPDQFDVPGSLGGWCVLDTAVAAGWRVDRHPRVLAQLTKRGHTDIVGFGECGVWTALGNGDGSFQEPKVVLVNFGYNAGGWHVEEHPRFVVDLTADGCGDIVGFGDAGVWTALGNGDGTFQDGKYVVANFGLEQGWRVDEHPRVLAHLTDSGFADIVGFGNAGVWTAVGNGDGTFQEPKFVLENFGVEQEWQVDRHPRFVVDLTGDGRADIVGFGDAGVWTALGNGDGTFQEPKFVVANFGVAQGWQVDEHPRFLAHLTDSGFADVVGFGFAGVWTALGNGDGTFQEAKYVLANFGLEQGWQLDEHPRFLANLTRSGFADIVGFGYAGVWTALSNGDGTFQEARYVLANFGLEQAWRVDKHPRLVTSLTRTNPAEIVGFGDAGVWTAVGDGQGGFPTSNYVLANFGYGAIVLALMFYEQAIETGGVWRSTDGGATWQQVLIIDLFPSSGQIRWAQGSDHFVCVVGGSSIFISKNAGASFNEALDVDTALLNHVAVWQSAPAETATAIIYVLAQIGNNESRRPVMLVSVDGGSTWGQDNSPTFPSNVGDMAWSTANACSPSVMVVSPAAPTEVYIAANPNQPPVLWHGTYSFFPPAPVQSTWEQVHLPQSLVQAGQDSGNVFLGATQPGRGDLLFYGAQRNPAFVGRLNATLDSDWQALDPVHVDLHGILLSPNFAATLDGGVYQHDAGTVWILSDGGISWSIDGGKTFQLAHDVNSLSCVNVAGVSGQGIGPALSLNTGDNDGFYSLDGGATWFYQQYGGGDNDCSFADPLQPNTMLVFTPRWDTAANLGSARLGQTVAVYQTSPGQLPDARVTTNQRRAVTGPPTLQPSDPSRAIWNASSGFGNRGSRPVVCGLSGEAPPAQGDYAFILFNETESIVVRTQNIMDIVDRSEWLTAATGPGQGANVFQQGPPLPNPGIGIVQASGGHAATVFYVGQPGLGLWSWSKGGANWNQLLQGGDGSVLRFFVDPYRQNFIYAYDNAHIKRSDNSGATWQVDQNLETQLTWGGAIPATTVADDISIGDHFDSILTDMKFDPNNPLVRFAVGQGGAFYTNDSVNWIRLLHTGAIAGRPANCYYDWITNPDDPALYVSFAGRSLMKISQLPQSTVV